MSDWDPEELRSLRSFFLEEAQEHLESIERALAALLADPTERESLAEFLRKLHTLKGSAGSVQLDALAGRAHRLEDRVVAMLGNPDPVAADELGELEEAVARLRADLDDLQSALAAPAVGTADARHGDRRAGDRRAAPRADRRSRPDGDPQTLRVDVLRVDELMDAASELVFDRTRTARRVQELEGCVRDLRKVRAQLSNYVGSLEGSTALSASEAAVRAAELASELSDTVAQLSQVTQGALEDSENLTRTSATLQEQIRRIRMMEVGRLFRRFDQPLADLARREGKRVQLRTVGEETEIDKAVVERIAEPLLHLVRNAVAHGVEDSAERVRLGKPPAATVTVSARHQGDAVEIAVEDDGRGVDLEAVRRVWAKARRLSPEVAERLTEHDLLEALFAPQFSTRDVADDVAGRGVGLDAVREAISKLAGAVTIRSRRGEGTRFVVRLPLSTAVQQALLFKVGGQAYAVPAARVEEAVQITPDDLHRHTNGSDLVVLRATDGTTRELPVVRLGALLGAPPPPGVTKRTALVLTASAGGRFAITCDKVIGTREIVVRALGPLLSALPLFAGATISGAGKVQLILDVEHLAIEAARGVRATRPTHTAGPRRVLVVDDSRAVREATSLILLSGGYAVESVSDGWDAWELLQDRPFDLLVTDLEMPRLDGHELISRVRRAPELASMPILVVSSRNAETMRHRILTAGANGFVSKPVRKKALLDGVEALLDEPALPE